MSLYRLDQAGFDHLFAGKMVGPKCEAVRVALHRCEDPDKRDKVKAMVEAISTCVADRNTLTHGLWGWKWVPKEGLWHSCAWSRAKDRYVYTRDLPRLHNAVANATVKADVAWYAVIHDEPAPTNMNRRMMFSPDDPASLPGPPPSHER